LVLSFLFLIIFTNILYLFLRSGKVSLAENNSKSLKRGFCNAASKPSLAKPFSKSASRMFSAHLKTIFMELIFF